MKKVTQFIRDIIKAYKLIKLNKQASFVEPSCIDVKEVERAILNEFYECLRLSGVIKPSEVEEVFAYLKENPYGWYNIDLKQIAIYASERPVKMWNERLEKDLKFWKDVVLKNASINNNPHIVANEVIEEMKSKFNATK